MEWIIFYGIMYMTFGLMTSIATTKFSYRDSLKKNKNAIPETNSVRKKYPPEERDRLEVLRRKKLASEALRVGFWAGVFWPVMFVVFTVLFLAGFVMKIVHEITIKPEDANFISDMEYRKAEAIIAKYDLQQKEQFEKELGE